VYIQPLTREEGEWFRLVGLRGLLAELRRDSTQQTDKQRTVPPGLRGFQGFEPGAAESSGGVARWDWPARCATAGRCIAGSVAARLRCALHAGRRSSCQWESSFGVGSPGIGDSATGAKLRVLGGWGGAAAVGAQVVAYRVGCWAGPMGLSRERCARRWSSICPGGYVVLKSGVRRVVRMKLKLRDRRNPG
jgi:hypothetical protein